jgi:arylsulfatase A
LRLLVLMLAAIAAAPGAEVQPNIVLIVADDLGYADLGCYVATAIATPRIDQLARDGVRFTDAYAAAPFCSPSRAALLTGRLPARCGLPYVLFPAEHHGLPAAEITLAELLKPRGYATACIGKWHLGWDEPFRPHAQGFDLFYGVPYSNDSNEWPVGAGFMQVMGLAPFPLIDGDKVIDAPADQAELTQRYTKRAVAFIREHRARPFFLYLPHTMPHVPQYASARFAGKSKAGLYGDTVEEIDWSTGVIVDTLRELGLAEKTLVIFTSDNGAPRRGMAATPAAKAKTKAVAGERFPGRSHAGSNGPLRGGKGTTFEGGVRVPLIACWPGTIAPRRVERRAVSLLDVFPTCAKLARAALPSDRTYDGGDLGRAFADVPERPLFHYFGYQLQAIRDGQWKLFLPVDSRPEPRPQSLWFEHQARVFETQHRLLAEPELYDLSADAGEARNVATEHPEVVARLTRAARAFDAALQRDRRPMQFVEGPRPPEPNAVRTEATDLSVWQKSFSR